MIEIIVLIFFIRKIRIVSNEKNLSPKKWIWRLIITWFTVEFAVLILFISVRGSGLELNEKLMMELAIQASIPALALASLSAFYVMRQLTEIESFETKKEEVAEDKFKHFR